MRLANTLATLSLLAGCLAFAPIAEARSLVDATPNMPMPVLTAPGEVEFIFAHRFDTHGGTGSDFEASPLFTLSAGLAPKLEALLNYSPSTSINADKNHGNVFEPMLSYQFCGAEHPVQATAMVAYNSAAISGDGAVMAVYERRPFSLRAIAKAFSSTLGAAGPGTALGAGAVFHFNENWSVCADWNQLVWSQNSAALDPAVSTAGAWSGGLNFAIPFSPHSVMLYATNANNGTLQEGSVGSPFVRYGFSFAMPFGQADRYLAIFNPPKP